MLEFKLRVSRSQQEIFRKAISLIDGVEILPDKDENLRRYLERHDELLLSLEQIDPQVQPQVDLGYQQLLAEIFKYINHVEADRREKFSPSAELDLARFKDIVIQNFRRSREASPAQIARDGRVQRWVGAPVSPTEVQVLVYKFGLKDGVGKSNQQVAELLGRSYSYANSHMHMAFFGIFDSLSEQGLISSTKY